MEQAFAVAKAFFELPESEKQAVAVDKNQRGWLAQGMSRLQGSKTHDLQEVFFWGTHTAADDADVLAGKPLCALNQWPKDFPRLYADLVPYYDAVCKVARCVMAAVAVSLDQPANFFDEVYAKPLARGQMVYYPASTARDEAEARFGVAPHTDFGVLTVLMQDSSGGLQVRAKSGDWIEAPPIPGTLVCNIGDLLARWSNKRFASIVHRVINRTSHARYSFDLLAWGGLSVVGLRDAINNAVDAFNGSGRLCFAFSNHDVPRSATRQLAALGLSPEQSDAMHLLLLKLETCLIGSSCVYQGEELGLEDVTDIPVEQMQDPWGVKFAPEFLGRDTCRTPMVWEKSKQHGGFSTAASTWLPVSSQHLKRAALDMARTDGSIYQQFVKFLAWRKNQPAIMNANMMSAVSGDERTLVFDRISDAQTLRCTFDFDTLSASFEEI
jgi:hypothetical protein